jgi:hypothetical protein
MLVTDPEPWIEIRVSGPSCLGSPTTLSVDGAWASYLWLPGGQTTSTLTVSPTQPATFGVVVTGGGGCQRHGTITLEPSPVPQAPALDVPRVMTTGAALTARAVGHDGSAFTWSVTGGALLSGQGTSVARFTSSSSGTVALHVVETSFGSACVSPAALANVTVRDAVATTGFFALAPCRLLDTRDPAGPAGGPVLAAHGSRLQQVTGACGVPVGAKAIAANITLVNPGAAGSLFAWPGDLPQPPAPAAPMVPGRTRAVNGVLSLAGDGSGALWISNESAGAADVILDVNGYFE